MCTIRGMYTQLVSHLRASFGLIPYKLPCEVWYVQKVHVPCRWKFCSVTQSRSSCEIMPLSRACIVEYFPLRLYLAQFPLKFGWESFKVIENGTLQCNFLLVCHCKFSSILYHFRIFEFLTLKNIVTLNLSYGHSPCKVIHDRPYAYRWNLQITEIRGGGCFCCW